MPALSLPRGPAVLPVGLQPGGTLLYRIPHQRDTHSIGSSLVPFIIGAEVHRLVSCYALFKWWLLLSQHPSCLGTSTSFVTKTALGALAGGLGCFPFEREAYPPRSDSRDSRDGIRSLIGSGSREGPKIHSVALPPSRSGARLTLKLFRGEPDISEFD